ncbi:MAG TPA: hypothetical protein VMI32_13970 [Candidatus Solibacter sp.]|nr:hypothetical protein [Candidatus Solibacter sp.]
MLEAVGISTPGKSAETVLNEFQRGGFLLTHLLECPLDGGGASPLAIQVLLERCVSSAAARIRRSLKPKRIILISEVLEPLLSRLTSLVLECPVILDDGKPFKLDSSNPSGALKRLRGVVNTANPGM